MTNSPEFAFERCRGSVLDTQYMQVLRGLFTLFDFFENTPGVRVLLRVRGQEIADEVPVLVFRYPITRG